MEKCVVSKILENINMEFSDDNQYDYLYGGVITIDPSIISKFNLYNIEDNIAFKENVFGVNISISDATAGYKIEVKDLSKKAYLVIKDGRKFIFRIEAYIGDNNYGVPTDGIIFPTKSRYHYTGQFSPIFGISTPIFYGTLLDFSRDITNETFDFNNVINVIGSIDDFAKSQIYFGRTSGTLALTCNGKFTYKSGDSIVTPLKGEIVYITYSDTTYNISTEV